MASKRRIWMQAEKFRLRGFRKSLRLNPTPSEVRAWTILKSRYGGLVQKQVLVGWFIPDFILKHKMLIIEIDGSIHHTAVQIKKDAYRDSMLKRCGFKILRVPNSETCDEFGLINKVERFDDVNDFKLEYQRAMGIAGGLKHVGLKSKWKNRKLV